MEHETTSQSPMNRRTFLRRTGATAAVAAALGTGSNLLTEAPRADAATTVTVWEYAENRGRWLRSLAPGFRGQNPGADVKIVSVPQNLLGTKLTAALLSGSGVPDLVEFAVGSLGGFFSGSAAQGGSPFVALESYLGQQKSILNAASAYGPWTYQGHIYGVGNEYNPVLMYYRWDLFQKAGIAATAIKTWQEFVDAGKEFKAKTGASIIGLPANVLDYWYFLSRQRGGGPVAPGNRVTCNNDVGVGALQFLSDLVYKYKIAALDAGLSPYPPNAAYFTALTQGSYGVVLGAPWYQGFMKDNAPNLSGKWRIAPMPKWDSHSAQSVVYGGTALVMPSLSPNKDLAWKFIAYAMLRPESQLQGFRLENLYPDMTTLYNNPALNQPDPYFDNQKTAQYLRAVASSLLPWIETSNLGRVFDAVTRLAIEPVMQGHQSAKAGLDAAAAEVAKLKQE